MNWLRSLLPPPVPRCAMCGGFRANVHKLHVGPHGAIYTICVQDCAAPLSALSGAEALRHIFITLCAGLTSLFFGHLDEAARLSRAALALAATDDQPRTSAWSARCAVLHGLAVDALTYQQGRERDSGARDASEPVWRNISMLTESVLHEH